VGLIVRRKEQGARSKEQGKPDNPDK